MVGEVVCCEDSHRGERVGEYSRGQLGVGGRELSGRGPVDRRVVQFRHRGEHEGVGFRREDGHRVGHGALECVEEEVGLSGGVGHHFLHLSCQRRRRELAAQRRRFGGGSRF